MIRAFLVTAITFAYVLAAGPPLLLYGVLTGNTDPVYRVGMVGMRMALRLAGVKVEAQGLEKIPRQGPVVFMCNHQGNCDPPAVIILLPMVAALVKKEFFRIPVLGRAMRMRKFVPVDRRNREQSVAAVEEAISILKAGQPFLVFPEGTRSPDGRLQPLKKGVFILAIKAGAPIVPISISGSSRIMPKGRFVIRPGRVRITIHGPIPTAGRSMDDRDAIMAQVRQALLSGLEKDEWPLQELASSSGSSTPPAAPSVLRDTGRLARPVGVPPVKK
jgi:1-acyl-sn-glycerol-3-phosphate acyltransferase